MISIFQTSGQWREPVRCPSSLRVRNFIDNSSLQDTLHHKAVKNQPCKPKACLGSTMTPKCLTRASLGGPSPPQDLLVQAIDFINQFYHSFKIPQTKDHLARVNAIAMEIETTGTYQLTAEELEFGAKQAWRNAPRCIGRIQWSNLQVFDARQCTTVQQMFHFLCDHMRFATNGGNIRSAITIFPHRCEGRGDFRVWNSQLLGYAGYHMPDGRILGDPSNAEFTELCIQLGWEPKYGLFDVLPLVLQANGEDPQIFEIPPELVLEVPLEHPRYEWFRDLQLKWYALPAVSNMLLEVGGLEFSACPFNGWYMGTEIGVRDLCDTQRYNILECVGIRMGLETQNLSSLWKDQALVAVNIAVIHSFQKHNVTITDHHSAAESFMRHMETEFRLRGGCPADWTWLVPPMSGALTPIFHQEMVSYILSPFFFYQANPWLDHIWCDERRPKKRGISFRAVARVAVLSCSLMSRVLARRVRCTVLFSTETGRSETFARRLHTMLNHAFNTRVLCMDNYNLSDLENETFLAVVTSTFGNGDCPRNGEHFKKHLFSLQCLTHKFRYCVFGLGSRMYPQFCAFARAVDAKLAALGAQCVTPMGEGDELNGQEDAFRTWARVVFQDACSEFGIQIDSQLQGTNQEVDTWDPLRYRLRQESIATDYITALSAMHSRQILPMRLRGRHSLQSPLSSCSTILLELEFDGDRNSVRFFPGDHIGVFPGNSAQLVAGILKHLPNAPPTNQSLQLECRSSTDTDDAKTWQLDGRIPACPLSQALTCFLDITTPPSQSLLRKLSQVATQEAEQERLVMLAEDSKEYSTWVAFRRPTFLEVLEEFPSLEPPATFLLSQLPPLKPRLYSVSSSPDLHPGELHLTVAVVSYHTQDGKGVLHHGVCSTWLNTIREGDMVPCFINSSDSFWLPPEPSTPIIMVAAGSGIAPFRAFWQQRLHYMQRTGETGMPMTLVFGCRSSDIDHLYREEAQEMRRLGILKNVLTAQSCQIGQPKVYVQDILRQQLVEEVFKVLHQDGGHLYVCGNVCMVQDVSQAVQDILGHQLGMSHAQAREYLAQLKSEKRYHEDVFGGTVEK
ncbi:nitric oxide synthase 2b, inducible [Megalops cyprinoides]|uniref:nitric oxide synthase 2b, inducible n=1 Tax=Megalops cyprinoides TaxID=118141 RepID=UPI001863E97F|nr:nitric oxide synthase 2b, inducible [Megalops cyprinoides]